MSDFNITGLAADEMQILEQQTGNAPKTRKTDVRTLQKMLEVAQSQVADFDEFESSESTFWMGVVLGLKQSLGEEVLELREVRKFTLVAR